MVEVRKVGSKKELKDFIDFPHRLYSNDDNYVPELYLAQKDLLNALLKTGKPVVLVLFTGRPLVLVGNGNASFTFV